MFRHFSIVIAALLLAVNLPSLDVHAEQATLSVSARDTGGKFFGPQIVQIVIEGPGIRDPDTNSGSVIVNGVNVPLVHLSDSRWSTFFAQASAFTTLANTADFPGSNNGNFWILGPAGKNPLFPNLPGAFGNNAETNNPMNPNLDINGDCPSVVNDQNSCVEWPYIRLFNFGENDQVSIRYQDQSVTLDYVRPTSEDILLTLDRDSYPIDAEIIFGLSDYMWNINPVEEDRVHFAFASSGTEVFYQPSPSQPAAKITGSMSSLNFAGKQILSIHGREGIKFSNTINDMPETVLIETFSNGGSFENFNGRADMIAKERNVQIRFDYFNESTSAGMARGDASVTVSKDKPKTSTPEVEQEEQEVQIEPYSLSEPTLVDLFGEAVNTVNIGESVLVQTTISNNLDEDQPFAYILQIKDENDFTIELIWIKGNIYAKKAFSPGISWIPDTAGSYRVEIFVWKSINEGDMLPLSKKLNVEVV